MRPDYKNLGSGVPSLRAADKPCPQLQPSLVRMGCFHFWVWQTGFDLAGQKGEETEAYMVNYLIATSFTFCLNNKNWIQILNGHKEKAKDGNFYLCSKWDSNFLAKCLVKSHDVNRCKVHYACKVMHKLLNGLAGCWLAGRPTH